MMITAWLVFLLHMDTSHLVWISGQSRIYSLHPVLGCLVTVCPIELLLFPDRSESHTFFFLPDPAKTRKRPPSTTIAAKISKPDCSRCRSSKEHMRQESSSSSMAMVDKKKQL